MKVKSYNLLALLLFSISSTSSGQTVSTMSSSVAQGPPLINMNQQLTYKVIPAANNTWGYEILVDGTPYIRQLTIPGMPGTAGFKRRGAAEKTAVLVSEKLRKNIVPPVISAAELAAINAAVK